MTRQSTRRQLLKNSLGLAALSSVSLGVGRVRGKTARPTGPVAIALGTAQDGGVPQANCFAGHCARVRAGEVAAPRVACLGIVDPATGGRFLIDATPDFVAQVGALVMWPGGDEASRPPTGSVRLEDEVQGILLTHAHMGHYTGLLHCGREAAATNHLPVHASAAMAQLLSSNEPFKRLVDEGRVDIKKISVATPIELTANLSVVPFSVVHRAELTDTLGLLIKGPSRTLMYVPDADTWDDWPVPFEHWLDSSDIALLDGTFYSAEELGHRWQGEVPHPPVVETVKLLADRVSPTTLAAGATDTSRTTEPGAHLEVWFTHLNHTNPLWDEASPQRNALTDAGFGVARRDQIWEL